METVREQWGMICPNCEKDEQLEIVIKTSMRLTAEGTTDDGVRDCSHKWDQSSGCGCMSCGWEGVVGQASEAADD